MRTEGLPTDQRRIRYLRVVYLGLLGAAMLAIVAGAVFFLGLGSGDSNGTSVLFVRPLNVAVSEVQADVYAPLVQTLRDAGLPTRLTAFAYLLVAILGRMTFLLPGVVFAFAAPPARSNAISVYFWAA